MAVGSVAGISRLFWLGTGPRAELVLTLGPQWIRARLGCGYGLARHTDVGCVAGGWGRGGCSGPLSVPAGVISGQPQRRAWLRCAGFVVAEVAGSKILRSGGHDSWWRCWQGRPAQRYAYGLKGMGRGIAGFVVVGFSRHWL